MLHYIKLIMLQKNNLNSPLHAINHTTKFIFISKNFKNNLNFSTYSDVFHGALLQNVSVIVFLSLK